MSNAGMARWHGDDYQARVFWENALNLLDPDTSVEEVSFEADGPKAFDDVVIRYNPPVVRSGPNRVPAEYYQVKWHVEYGGRFGFEDFVDPRFIGATSFSLLDRLKNARLLAPKHSQFAFLTTYRIKDADPLAELVSGIDKSLLVGKLFDQTTDKSRMGQVRKLWREHLQLDSDDALREVITGLRVLEGHRSLDELREQINLRAKIVGLKAESDAISEFRYDQLARILKMRRLNVLSRETFKKFCHEERLFADLSLNHDYFLKVAIRSFLGPAADIVGASPENTLLLTEDFQQRYLRDTLDWQCDIFPKIEKFLRASVIKSPKLRLTLDAHASIAFISGKVLDLKSGVEVELIQKGRVGSRTWRIDDGTPPRDSFFRTSIKKICDHHDIAIAISISQATDVQVRAYVSENLPHVGTLICFSLPLGPGHQSVGGGEHAAALADQVSLIVREVKLQKPGALVHIFSACPNAFLFFLGQQHQGIAPCVVYEFDFDRQQSKTYQPSLTIN